MSRRRSKDVSREEAAKHNPGDESRASKTVSFRWKADAKKVQQILDAAARGELDRIPIKVANKTIFLSIDTINVGTDVPGVAAQTWSKREQTRVIQAPVDDKEQGNTR